MDKAEPTADAHNFAAQLKQCDELIEKGDLAALDLARQIVQQAVDAKDEEAATYAYCALSRIYIILKFDYEKALAFATLAMQHSDHLQPGRARITAMHQTALCCQRVGDLPQCITLAHQCFDMLELYGTTDRRFKLLDIEVNDILSTAYINLGLLELSRQYTHNMLTLATELNDEKRLWRARMFVANQHKYLKEDEKALEKYLDILRDYNGPENDQLAMICSFVGELYQNKKDYVLAELYYLKSIRIREQLGNELRTFFSYFSYTHFLYTAGRKQEGEVYFNKWKDILNRNPERFDDQLVNNTYAELYGVMGDYKLAYEYTKKQEPAIIDPAVVASTVSHVFDNERKKQKHTKEQADQLARLNSEMKGHADKLEASNKDLKSYAHTTSHDLREPLRMVSTYMTILEAKLKDKLSEEEKMFLKFAVDGSRRMDEMITAILNSAKGNRTANIKPVDLNKVVSIVQQNLTRLISDKKAVVVSDNTMPTIVADEIQIIQVLQNLVTNAIKYNNSPVPEIHISSVSVTGKHTLSISDNGVGIPEAQRDKVFEMFTRVENPSGADGTGIGLSTVKTIIEKMKGKIWIEGNQPHGSIFKIELPA